MSSEVRDNRSGYVRVGLGALAIGGVVFGVASLIAMLAVLLIRDTDALAAIALVLAIVTFASQIIVYMTQSAEANRQSRAAHELHARTMETSKELEGYARATHAAVAEQFDKVLDRALIAAKEPASGAKTQTKDIVDPRRIRDEVLRELSQTFEESRRRLYPSPVSDDRRSLAPRRHLDFLHRWPTERGMRRLANDGLHELTDAAVEQLKRYVVDLEQSVQIGVPDGLTSAPQDPGIRELVNRNLLEAADGMSTGGRIQYRLNGFKGRAAARLLLANEATPSVAVELFPWLPDARGDIGRDVSPREGASE